MTPRAALLLLLSAPILALTPVAASDDFCPSGDFRNAFLEGWQSQDYPSMSPKLIGFGDRGLPCLGAIVDGKFGDLGITACRSNQRRCQTRALAAIGQIDTPEAKGYLSDFLLNKSRDPELLESAMLSLGFLRNEQARPAVVDLLVNSNMRVRANAVLTLGVIGKPEDFDGMLAATLSLPPEEIYRGAQGLLKLGDPRAIEPLEKHAKTISDPTFRNGLEFVIKSMKLKRDSRPS